MASDIVADSVRGIFSGDAVALQSANDAPADARFWVIPGRAGPRWIVPQDAALGWPALRLWRPYDAASRAKWTLVTAAYRAGELGRLPGVAALGVAGCDGWRHLGWDGDAAPVAVIHIGTPGPTRKAIATLVDRAQGRPLAVAKAPLGPAAAGRILHEAAALDGLAREAPGVAPRPLFSDPATGRSLQTFAAGAPSGMRLTAAHLGWLDRLRVSNSETSLRDGAEALARRLRALPRLDDGTRRRYGRLLEGVAFPEPLPAFRVHGDFAPWNLRRAEGETLIAFDWEFSETPGLPGHDLVHFLCRVLLARGAADACEIERKIRAALAAPRFRRLLGGLRPAPLWRYYVLWYRILCLENGIDDACARIFNQIVETWDDEPLQDSARARR
ncbi:MAG: hypothetical protein ACE5H8_11530 [Alphaproteobacteria bacterium]